MDGGGLTYSRRRVRDRLRTLIRSDSVRNFIWIFYFGFIAGSIHLAFFARPINVIIEPMGQSIYNAWAWMPLVAAPIVAVIPVAVYAAFGISFFEIFQVVPRAVALWDREFAAGTWIGHALNGLSLPGLIAAPLGVAGQVKA